MDQLEKNYFDRVACEPVPVAETPFRHKYPTHAAHDHEVTPEPIESLVVKAVCSCGAKLEMTHQEMFALSSSKK